MLDFEELKEKFSDFVTEKPLLARIAGIILIFFLIGLMILFIQSSKPKPKEYSRNDIVLDAKPLPPSGPDIEKEYYISRKTENTWSDAEIKEYFSNPDASMISELEKSNDKLVSEITEAAP